MKGIKNNEAINSVYIYTIYFNKNISMTFQAPHFILFPVYCILSSIMCNDYLELHVYDFFTFLYSFLLMVVTSGSHQQTSPGSIRATSPGGI